MAAKYRTTIRKDGPFFQRDPGATLNKNIHTMAKAIASEGARDVIGQMQAGEATRAPIQALGTRVSDHVAGELRRYPGGPAYSVVVHVANRGWSPEEATSLMAAAAQVEAQTRAFRKTQGRILRSRHAQVDELLKGIA